MYLFFCFEKSKLKEYKVLKTINLDDNQITDFSPLKETTTLNVQGSVFGTQNVKLEAIYGKKGNVSTPCPIVKDLNGNIVSAEGITNGGYVDGNSIIWNGYDEGLFEETIVFNIIPLNATVNIVQPISIDKTSPELSVLSNETKWTNKDVTLTIKATDSNSGIDYIELYDGSKIYSSDITIDIKENDTYNFKAYDKAGNVSEKSIVISNIDKEKPIASSSVIYNSNNKEAIIKVDSSDSISDIDSITTLEGKVVKDSKLSLMVKTNGTYEFIIKDLAGNETIKSVIVDKIGDYQVDDDSITNPNNPSNPTKPNSPTDNIPSAGGVANMLFISYLASFVAGFMIKNILNFSL